MTSTVEGPTAQATPGDAGVPPPTVPVAEVAGTETQLVPPARTSGGRKSRARARDGVHHTRISGAWAAIFVAVLLGVALIDFLVENTRTMRIDFFGASGHIPAAVGLLAAALTGAVVVLTVGVCRTAQLRFVLRRNKASGSGLGSQPNGSPTAPAAAPAVEVPSS